MATGFTKNFVVKNGITTGNITLDATSGNITGTNLSVTGLSELGNIGNVKITGGTSGQAIVTDGAGNLSFANASASSSPAPMPTYVAVGDDLLISANYQGLFGYPITIDGTMTVDGILIDVNDNGNGGGGGGTATALNASISNVIITGGTSGYYLQTDGTGNLSWAAGGGGGSGSPGGVNTQVQFNDAGTFGGNTGFTFNKTTGTLVSTYFSGAGNALSNIQGANVTGAVSYATTANSVAAANVSGLGNVALINKDGNASNVLYGNGVFAAPSGGGSYGDSNVVTLLTSYGSNTITTTGNVSVGNIIGNGQALSGIVGSNVSGQVGNALVAGTVYTAAQPNITSTGTLASLSVSGNANIGNIGAADGVFTANVSANNLTTTNKVTAGNGLLVSTGSLTVLSGNLDVTGNLNVTGNVNYSNVTDLIVGDPLIFLGANNTGDAVDLGIVASYNNGNDIHTGIARNASNDYWTFFDGVVAEPTTVIDWANATYPTVKLGTLVATANVSATGNVTANYLIGNGSQITGIAKLTVSESDIAGSNVTNTVANVSTLKFDKTTGFSVTDLGNGDAVISLGSTFKTWEVTGQPSLVAVGEDTVQFVAGSGITITTSNVSTPKSITITSTGGGGGGGDTLSPFLLMGA